MTIQSTSSLKRPHDLLGPSEESDSKKQKIENPPCDGSLLEQMASGESLSLMNRIAARELGLPSHMTSTWDHYQRGKWLLEQGRIEEASQSFSIVKSLFNVHSGRDWKALLSIGDLEYDFHLFPQAHETQDQLISLGTHYSPLAYLKKSLIYAHQDEINAFEESFEKFYKQWCAWTILKPHHSPLLLAQRQMHFAVIETAISEISGFIARNENGDNDPLYEALAWLYFAQRDFHKAYWAGIKVLEIDDALTSGDVVTNLCALLDEGVGSKETALDFFNNGTFLYLDENFKLWVLWKIVLEEGLKTGDPLLLNPALRHFQEFNTSFPHTNLYLLSYLFFAHFALGHIDEALQTAERMEAMKQGSALLERTLCRLSQADQPDQTILDDLQKVLQQKAPGDPAFLKFVGHYLAQKSASLPSKEFLEKAESIIISKISCS